MAALAALADRVRVSHTNHGDLGSYGACDEGGQEGVHGACACRSSTACLGCALLRAPAAGLARRARGGAARDGASGEGLRCSPTRVVGARADGAGTATTQTFSTTGRFGFAKPEHRRAQVPAGDASGPRPAGTGAQRPPCKSKASGAALPARAASRGPRGSHRARSTRRCPPLDARATAPSDSLFSELRLPCSRSCPAAAMVAAALLYHWVATHLYLLTSWAGLAAITIIIARWQWERVERLIKARIIREMERKAGVPISIEALTCRPIKGELGLTNLIVKRLRRQMATRVLHENQKLTCKAHGGLLGCASLAGMISVDLGTHLPFIVGFKGKMVDAMTCVGMEVFVETSHTG